MRTTEPHARGAILVSAVFEAFLNVYEDRTSELIRIARRLEGNQTDWQIHPEIASRLADEASMTARDILQMCIRAIDYLPPVDLTFEDFLRAIITADRDHVPVDVRGYRLTLIDALRRRGMLLSLLSDSDEDGIGWSSLTQEYEFTHAQKLFISGLRSAQNLGHRDRRQLSEDRDSDAADLHGFVQRLPFYFDTVLGISRRTEAPQSIPRQGSGSPVFEVHSVRAARRVGPGGYSVPELFFEVTQRRRGYRDADVQKQVDAGTLAPPKPDFYFRGGATLVIDLGTGRIRYSIVKPVGDNSRLDAERKHRQTTGGFGFAEHPEPFAMLHRDLA